MTGHPITPPLQELIEQWIRERDGLEHLAIQAARWGADHELEACVKWIEDCMHPSVSRNFRAARRPKPQPVTEGPSAGDVTELFYRHMGEGSEVGFENAIAETLSRWGSPTPVPVAIPGEKYHEDMGPVTWWRLPVDEPPWVGTPNDSDWPGYHTHFTPAPTNPLNAHALPTPETTND